MNKFDVGKFGEYIAKYKPQSIGGLPHIIRILTENEYPPEVFETIAQMQNVMVGGAPFPKRLEDEFNAKIDAHAKGHRKVRVDQAWGMTECGWVGMGIAKLISGFWMGDR
jgi:acyl-coenzyme A synthetase/AMP-(fatty) acid ligase